MTTLPQIEEYDLAEHLREIARIDSQDESNRDYELRNVITLHALSCAASAGLEAGIRIDPKEPEWPVAYIELPEGQVSWHMAQHPKPWDGHENGEKYLRVHRYCDRIGTL